MLLWMRFVDICLGDFLHHKVGVDLYVLHQLAVVDSPCPGDGEDADRWFCVDEGVHAVRDISEGELVGCLGVG